MSGPSAQKDAFRPAGSGDPWGLLFLQAGGTSWSLSPRNRLDSNHAPDTNQ